MNTMKSVFSKIAEDKTELAKHEVNLGIIDDISRLKKETERFLADSNKADAAIQKAVATIKDKGQFWLNNKKFSDNLDKRADALFGKYEKAAKELGLDVKNSPAAKEMSDIYNYSSQINDNIGNIMGAIKSIK